MIPELQESLRIALRTLIKAGDLPPEADVEPRIDRTRDSSHGDYATNIAMQLSKLARCNPRALAEKIILAASLPASVAKYEIAGPGFINFHVSGNRWAEVLRTVLDHGPEYGRCQPAQRERVHLE